MPVTPLLSIVESAMVKRIDVLKIDIEGFEDQAHMPFCRRRANGDRKKLGDR